MNNITDFPSASAARLPRMRTLDECIKELKNIDPSTSVTKYFVRGLALSGAIPTVMVGRKRLINLDGLIQYLNEPHTAEDPTQNGIRRIAE